MKKFISILMSAAIASASLSALPVSSAGTDTKNDFVLFGDSIAAGYGLSSSEHNYGELCADYLGGNVSNYAVSGATSTDMLSKISSLSDDQKTSVKNAEYVVISVGANDLLHYASKRLLTFGEKKKLLKDGITSADIPAEPTITDLLKYLDIEKIKAYKNASPTNLLDLSSELKKLCANLKYYDEDYAYVGIIPKTIIPNLKDSITAVKAINPDAKVIVQTVYQPLQFTPEYLKAASIDPSLMDQISSSFNDVLDTFESELKKISGIEIADVRTDLNALPEGTELSKDNPGSISYFTNIQLPGENRDFHPNQRGHLAIAVTILDKIGSKHDDKGLLTQTFEKLSGRSDYPIAVLDKYKYVAGNILVGDVDLDGRYSANDASLALRNYALLSGDSPSPLSALQRKCADADHNDLAAADDASRILKYFSYVSSNGKLSFDDYFESLKNNK